MAGLIYLYKKPRLFASDKHVPVDHCVRSLTLWDLRNAHLSGHGLGQREHRTTEHDRICVTQISGGEFSTVSSVHEINGLPLTFSPRQYRFVIWIVITCDVIYTMSTYYKSNQSNYEALSVYSSVVNYTTRITQVFFRYISSARLPLLFATSNCVPS